LHTVELVETVTTSLFHGVVLQQPLKNPAINAGIS
jgi:hypothetical protein